MGKTNCYVYAKHGRIIECFVQYEPIGQFEPIEQCYRRSLNQFLEWLSQVRLPALIEADAALKGNTRQNRLHRSAEKWNYALSAHLTECRYLSVTLTVTGEGDQFSQCFRERRVWDAEKGILCPLSYFLPMKRARKYDKWEYSLENGELTVFRKGKMYKLTVNR